MESQLMAGTKEKDAVGTLDPEPDAARTPLGRRLAELRARIVASGEPLLDWSQLEREIAERRGELDHPTR
jgi:hypothetical protein